MKLSDKQIKALKPKDKQYKLADGGGLNLVISPNGSKYFRLKYRFLGREKTLSIGVYPQISLKEARERRDEAKKQILEGIDPSQQKRVEKLIKIKDSENSFEAIARQWHASKAPSLTPKYASDIIKRLEADILPDLGYRPIAEIKPPELLLVLKKIEARGAIDIAKRALQVCGQIFRYAVANCIIEQDITLSLKGSLQTRKIKHHSHLKEEDLQPFLAQLKTYDGEAQTRLALEMLILTFVRTGELIGAKWEEINFEKREWHIPAERMKMKEKHIVPLAPQTLALIEQIKSLNNNIEYLFPHSHNSRQFMSNNTMLYAIYRLGYHSRTTAHGFRSTASTILNENNFREDIIERQLAHAPRNSVRASYNHAEYLPERHKMMQWWANFVDDKRGA